MKNMRSNCLKNINATLPHNSSLGRGTKPTRKNTPVRVAWMGGLVLLAGLGFCQPAAAQGFYVAGAMSHAAINETVVDDTRNAYKFALGYEFEQVVGLEASWVNFGEFDGTITAAGGSTRVGYDAKTATAAVTGRIPIGEHFHVFAKAGYMFWSTDVKFTGTGTDTRFVAGTDHGNDPFYGAGVRVNINQVSVFAEWERYKLNRVNIEAISVGVRFTFRAKS